MAEEKKEKKEKESKVLLERVYNVPLRKEFQKAPEYVRTKKAVKALRKFLLKHMKAKQIKIGRYLNLELWKQGIRNPPHHVKVNCIKHEDGLVYAEIVGAPKEEIKEPEKKAEKRGKKEEKKQEAELKIEEIKEEKKEESKEIEKEEIKELKKERLKVHSPKEFGKEPAFKEHKRELIPGR